MSKQSKGELQQKTIEKNFERNKSNNILLYESHKVVIESGYLVYCDGTIEFYSKSKKDKGFRIPKALLKWVKLPKKESQSIKLQADFYFEDYENKKIRIEDVNIELYNKKLGSHFTFFVYPIGQGSKETLVKSNFNKKEKMFCIIKSENLKKHFEFTKEFKERSKVRLETKLPVNYKNLELIVRGELRGTSFEIYQTKDGN